MKGKNAALAWSVIHSIGDIIEEKVLLKFNETAYLFWMNFATGIVTILFSIIGGVELTWLSFGVIIVYSIAIIGGDFCYVKAIQTLPIGLANLIDSGSLFIILICDILLGYIAPKLSFFFLFILFFLSIYIFSNETNKMKNEITNKKIDFKNIFILITSTIFYASEPYFIKLASSKGANELGINLTYYIVAIPIFYYLYKKDAQNKISLPKKEKKEFIKNMIILGIIYATTSFIYMLAFIGETPVLITLITKLQLFIVVLISVIRKTDKMNWKKTISLLMGVTSIVLMTLIS